MRCSAFVFACCLLLQVAAAPAHATVYIWQNSCSEDQVNNSGIGDGSTDSAATGFSDLRYEDTSDEFSWSISWDGLEADLTAIHVHGPASPSESSMPHFFNIFTGEADVIASGLDRRSDTSAGTTDFSQLVVDTSGTFTPSEVLGFMDEDRGYTNIHSSAFPMGEIRCNLNQLGAFQPQTKGQQKCLAKFEKGAAQGFSKLPAKLAKCMKVMAKDGGYTDEAWEACLAKYVTPTRDKLSDKGAADAAKFCTGENTPDLDVPADADGIEFSAGIMPDAVLVYFKLFAFPSSLFSTSTTPEVAGCAAHAMAAAGKCVATMSKEFASCAKLGRKGKSGVSFVLPEDVLTCVAADAKGKVEKACGAGSAFEKKIVAKCDGLTEAVLSPGLADAVESVRAVEGPLRCASCILSVASAHLGAFSDPDVADVDALAICDVVDDGVVNTSCGS